MIRKPSNRRTSAARRLTAARLAVLLAAATVALFLAQVPWRAPLTLVWADEGTYLAMAESLSQDFDLWFNEDDAARLQDAESGRSTVILQRTPAGISYSKPVLFALLAAPFFALADAWGLVLLNALALALAVALAAAYLRRVAPGGQAALILVTFLGASVLLPYVFWRMSDILQASLSLAGLVLVFASGRGRTPEFANHLDRWLVWRGAPWLGAALLGLVASQRLSNVLLAMLPAAAALLERRWRRALGMGMAALAPFFVVAALGQALTGTSNPYRAERTTFSARSGYPSGAGASEVGKQFVERAATHRTGLKPQLGGRRTALATLYFFVGRHTGLLFYFPAALALGLAALRGTDRNGLLLLAGFAGSTAFYLIWMPWNYFGGETFLGNRYLLAAYPALLLAPKRLPGARLLAASWLLALLAQSSALTSVVRYHEFDRSSQSHARSGVFRLLPYESTAQGLSGRRDKYWSQHFVRFVDPFSTVKKNHFELRAGDPPAELMTADWRPPGKIRLLVTTDAPRATLRFTDYGGGQLFALGIARGPRSVRVDLEPSTSWRQHQFWWIADVAYHIRSFRLQLFTPNGEPASARLRYLGDPVANEGSFGYRRLDFRLHGAARAGATSTLEIQLLNTSEMIWQAGNVMPVRLRLSFFTQRKGGAPVFTSEPFKLPNDIYPGKELRLEVPLTWPEVAGQYRLEGDLELYRVGTFASRLGRPLVSRWLTVEPAIDEP